MVDKIHSLSELQELLEQVSLHIVWKATGTFRTPVDHKLLDDLAIRIHKEIIIQTTETMGEGDIQQWSINGKIVTAQQVESHRRILAEMIGRYNEMRNANKGVEA